MTLIPSKDIPLGQDVDLFDTTLISRISKELIEGIREHGPAIGLSAVQIGYEYNMFIVDFSLIKFKFKPFSMVDMVTFINTTYTSNGKRGEVEEGCLSLPGYTWTVPRYRHINVSGHFWNGMEAKEFTLPMVVHPITCIAFQHEVDHQQGILLEDIGRNKTAIPEVEEMYFGNELDPEKYDFVEVDSAGVPTTKDSEEEMVIKNKFKETRRGLIIPGE